MDGYEIGQTVRVISGPMEHSVGTVVYFYEKDGTILVRIGGMAQNYFWPDELEPFLD